MGKLYNTLGFPVSSCRTSEILALVEFLSRTLITYNFLVARYEPGKESSVSVCHNSEFYWLIIEGVVNNYAGSGYHT